MGVIEEFMVENGLLDADVMTRRNIRPTIERATYQPLFLGVVIVVGCYRVYLPDLVWMASRVDGESLAEMMTKSG